MSTNDAGKRTGCAIENERVRPCWALNEVLEDAGKGIRYVQLTKLTGSGLEDGRGFVAAFSGEHKKRGLILNHCPFCAADIGAHMKATEGVRP